MLWLNYDGGSTLDAFWYAVSYKFSWIPLYVAMLVVMVRYARQHPLPVARPQRFPGRHLHTLVLIILTTLIILAADQISSGLIKPLVQRPRPSHEPGLMEMLHYVYGYHGGQFGFVSSHAANTLALAVWISLLFRNRTLLYAMVTFYLVNCYSRIYLGVHYPGDILCGSVIGALCGWLGYTIYKVYLRHRKAQHPPTGTVSVLPIALTFWASMLIMAGFAVITSLLS